VSDSKTEKPDADGRVVKSVCLVSRAWPAGSVANGIVSYTDRLSRAMVGLGVDTTLLVRQVHPPLPTLDPEDGGRLRVIAMKDYWDEEKTITRIARRMDNRLRPREVQRRTDRLLMAQAVERAQGECDIDILQVEDTDGAAESIYRLKPPFPVVVRLHGPWFLNGSALGVAQDRVYHERVIREGEMIRRADAVTAPSQDVLERTREFYKLPLRDAVVIPNPIQDIPADQRWSPEKADPDRLLFVGRFDRHKGADVAIRAFAHLARDREKLVMDFVGPDRGIPDASGASQSLEQFLDRELPDPAVRQRVCIHGQLNEAQIRTLRTRAAVTLVPSRYETFGNVALECQVAGAPVVVSDVGGLREIVTHEQTGLVHPAEDAQGLAMQIVRFLDDPQLALRMSQQGRASALARYAPEVIARETLAHYESVADRFSQDAKKRGVVRC